VRGMLLCCFERGVVGVNSVRNKWQMDVDTTRRGGDKVNQKLGIVILVFLHNFIIIFFMHFIHRSLLRTYIYIRINHFEF
jgi:hypothetical protein